jgi:hypothetical protein
MTKPGRIPCINPQCRRTAPADGDDETQIICGKCWRTLPRSLRDRYQQLSRREKNLLRVTERKFARGEIGSRRVARIACLIEGSRGRNWASIRAYFRPIDKPVGLDGFLQEIGL